MSHAAERPTTKRAGEVTFGLGQVEIIHDLLKSGFLQQCGETERPGREKSNSVNTFVRDLCCKTKQKNRWVGGNYERQRLLICSLR